ncbi:MAG: 50S ribosomal protein L11 methyltransferase, partial [Kingella oralis]
THTGGRIVLSGILEEQIDEMSAIYAQWFDLAPAIVNNGWACITGTKR